MARIGYARVSTAHQNEAAQVAALKESGCDEIFAERVSTRKLEKDRPQLQAALDRLQVGDVLVVAKLDRLGRTQHEVINRLHDLQQAEIHVETLDGLINTKALGKMAPLIVGLLTGLAEVERDLIRSRTIENQEYRRSQGKSLGGRPKAYTAEQADLVLELRGQGKSYRQVARATGLSLGVVQRIIAA